MQFDYRPQKKFREGNVFTGVFLSTWERPGGDYVSSDDHQVSLVGVWVYLGGKGGEYILGDGWISQVLGGHQNTYCWQAVGMHTTGMLSCLVMRLRRYNHVFFIK